MRGRGHGRREDGHRGLPVVDRDVAQVEVVREVRPAAAGAHSPDRVIVARWRETAAAAVMRRRRCSRPLCRWLAGRWPRSTGVRADSRHSGTAGTRMKGVDAASMLYQRHERGIHVVSVRRRRSGGHVSPVTTACQERRNTSSQGRGVRYPAQDQLQLNGTAARLRPDAIRTRPQRSRRHELGTSLSPRVVRTPRIGHREHQAGRGSRRPGGATPAAVPRTAETATQRSPVLISQD
jgi:hypothetical protein